MFFHVSKRCFVRATGCAYGVIACVAVSVLLWGCGPKSKEVGGEPIKLEHARLLKMENCKGFTLVTIMDPWKNNSVLQRYALVGQKENLPSDIPANATILRVPLSRLCVSTSLHTNLLMQLGALGHVRSICESKYILSDTIQGYICTHRIADVGSGMNPSVEKIVQLRTDALLMSPFEGASYGMLEKTDIPIVQCADYMESSALGRAEWMKFYGMLVGKEKEASQLFNAVAADYDRLKALASSQKSHPKLLVDMLNGNTWYMAGGGSVYGSLYRDLGADYSIGNPEVSGSEAMSLEKVMHGALDADVWLVKYGRSSDYDLQSFGAENAAYKQFNAYMKKCVYGCNTSRIPFYDEVPFRPDLLMQDIIKILYPHLLKDYHLRYYQKLE